MKHSPAFEKIVSEAKKNIREISIDQLLEKRAANESFTLIDVREDHEWAAGYIEKALHLGRGIIERDIENHFPDNTACLVLYCGGGYRSALAADNLQAMGYNNIYSLQGGFKAWTEKKLPISHT